MHHSLFCHAILIEIDQKICLHQYLVIQTVNLVISVVMSDQIGHSPDDFFVKMHSAKHILCHCRPFLLLKPAVTASILFLRHFDPDIMYIGSHLECQQFFPCMPESSPISFA